MRERKRENESEGLFYAPIPMFTIRLQNRSTLCWIRSSMNCAVEDGAKFLKNISRSRKNPVNQTVKNKKPGRLSDKWRQEKCGSEKKCPNLVGGECVTDLRIIQIFSSTERERERERERKREREREREMEGERERNECER